ncbi:rubrerythrin [bacterium BMS3Abin01]|nr:rubrerythrin [bacterium BMS3Abin01]
MQRCSVCGNIMLPGQNPDKCPMCGAPKSRFEPFSGIDGLAGSKTEENLKTAFAGESQANRRYLAFAQAARAAGLEDVAAVFEAAAADETLHAHSHLAYLGMVRDSTANLGAALEGETYEKEDMYPGFQRDAEEEGFAQIAQYLRSVAGDETRHAGNYKDALDNLK